MSDFRSFGTRGQPVRARIHVACLVAASLAMLPGASLADVTPEQQYKSHLSAAQKVEPIAEFGEQVSLRDGKLSFRVVDIDVPGMGPPIRIIRTGAIEDGQVSRASSGNTLGPWEIEIPRIKTIAANPGVLKLAHHASPESPVGWQVSGTTEAERNARCTRIDPPGNVSYPELNVDFYTKDWWFGYQLVDDQGNEQPLLKRELGGAHIGTASNWIVGCLSQTSNGQPGEAFYAVAPDGTTYRFDYLTYVSFDPLTTTFDEVPPTGGVAVYQLPRLSASMLPTRVEDRFGNWVEYHYTGTLLTSITASDGRLVTLDRQGGTTTITVGSGASARTWTYSGSGTTFQVQRPDGSRWTYQGEMHRWVPAIYDYFVGCDQDIRLDAPPLNSRQFTVMAPSGATAVFNLQQRHFGRSHVPKLCNQRGNPVGGPDSLVTWPVNPRRWVEYALMSREVSGPGLPTMTWSYAYSDPNASWSDCVGCPDTVWTEVTDPEGNKAKSIFSNHFDQTENKLKREEYRSPSGTLLRVVDYQYATAPGNQANPYPWPLYLGTSMSPARNRELEARWTPMKSRTITQQGTTYARTTTGYDAFARETAVTSEGPSGTRTETTSYHDDLSLWVLGQVASRSVNGIVTEQTTYNAFALPQSVRTFGKLRQTLTYEFNGVLPEGTLRTVTDGNGNTTTLSSWKLGIPQLITFADSSTLSAVVDDRGWITSVTDEAGYKTCYDYDAMGRIIGITYPSESSANCATSPWNKTNIAFVAVAGNEYGLSEGHWRHTVTTGSAVKTTYYDGLWRPVLAYEADNSDPSTAKYVATAYNARGLATFTSYPLASAPSIANGQWTLLGGRPNGVVTQYDALGRVTFVDQDSEHGPLTTATIYGNDSSGPYTRVTDPAGNQTKTYFQQYDAPEDKFPVLILHPEGAQTTIGRDEFGNPTAITRSGGGVLPLTRKYIYNAYKELCRSIEPETGSTVMAYDNAGNLAWSASGLALANDGLCHVADVPASEQVLRAYDRRNRLVALSFPDGRGDQDWSYTPDGLAATVTTYNDDPTDTVVNQYAYNHRRLLVQESQTLAGQPTVSIGYGYNANGHLASITYPDGETVSYAPNALGQPTKAGGYALGVSYYPNGAMHSFTYGNGIVHTLTQNARQLPKDSKDIGATTIIDDTYAYDENGNVASITDHRDATNTRTMTYDGLNRLTDVVSGMYGSAGAHYTYDALDNFIRVIAPGEGMATVRDYYYCYDDNRRLMSLKTLDCSGGATIHGLDYDARGNLANKDGQLFRFDLGNRLRRVEFGGGEVERYKYDAHGRRVSAIANGLEIRSLYGQDGVLRYQRDDRQGKAFNYVTLNGSLLARKATTMAPPPAAPVIAPIVPDGNDYTVTWSAVTGAVSYQLEESGDAGPVNYPDLQLSKTFTDQPDGTYKYRVRACNGSGACGAYSDFETVTIGTPSAPAKPSLAVVPTVSIDGVFTASWSSGVPPQTYRLEQSVDGSAWSELTVSGTSHAFSGMAPGVYRYRVSACNGATCVSSDEAMATVLGVPVLDHLPATNATGDYSVTWPPVPGNPTYELYESTNGGASWTGPQSTTGTAVSYSDKPNGPYAYRLRVCLQGTCTGYSAIESIAVQAPPKDAPDLTVPASVGDGNYTVSWTTVARATGYKLWEREGGDSWKEISPISPTSWSATDKDPGTYRYMVQGCNDFGCGPLSSEHLVQVPEPNAPQAPTLTVPDASDSGSYYANWTASTGASKYRLEERDASGVWTEIVSTPNLYFNITGRTNGSYDYRVRACATELPSSCGDYSNVETIAVAAVTPPPPTNLRGSVTPDPEEAFYNYHVLWDASAGAASYEVVENGSITYTVPDASFDGSGLGNRNYKVRACNAAGCSGWTDVLYLFVSVPTQAPVLSAPPQSTTGDYTVSWSSTGITSYYRLEERIGSGSWMEVLTDDELSLSFTGKAAGSYQYRVAGCNNVGCGPTSSVVTVSVVIPPGKPTLSVPASSTTGNYTVNWTAVSGASTYELEESSNGGASWNPFAATANLSRAFSDKPSGSYLYRVRACNAVCGSYSDTKTIQVNRPAVPGAPVLTAPASSSNGNYAVSWTSPPGATSFRLEEQANGGAWLEIQSSSATSKSFSGKPAGAYAYRARACNDGGCSGWSNTGSTQVGSLPPPPTGLAVTITLVGSQYDFDVHWNAVASATSYDLKELSNIVYSGPNTSFLSWGTTNRTYSVRACNALGCSAWSDTVPAYVKPPTSAPTLSVPSSSSTGNYTVSWTAVGAATEYLLQERVGSGSWTTLQQTAATSRNITGKGSGTYSYRVYGCNTVGGCGPASSTGTITVTIVTIPGAPTLSAPASSDTGSFTVSWGAVSGATSYRLEEQVNGGAWSEIQNNSATSKAISGKGNGSYGYRARACNSAGCSSYSATKTVVVTLPTAPGTPTLSVPASSSTGSYTVSWTSVSGATSYRLEEKIGSGTWTEVHNGSATSKAFSGKSSGSYSYRVRACNGAGCSGYSLIGTITVTLTPTIPPVPNLQGYTEIDDSVRPPLTNFFLSWSASAGATWYELNLSGVGVIYNGPDNSAMYTARGTKTFTVRACNTAGCSAWSSSLTL